MWCRRRDCADIDCGPHGTCEDGFCACEPGFSGERCHLSPSCAGFVTIDDVCCESGYASVVDGLGRSASGCCPVGSTVDRDGACCDGEVDACAPASVIELVVTLSEYGARQLRLCYRPNGA